MGRQVGVAGPNAEYVNPVLSPDGKYVAFQRGSPADIWVLDIQKGVNNRLTSHPAADIFPIWSPNGRTIVFESDREGGRYLFERAFGVVGEDKLLAKVSTVGPDDWSRDGRYIVYDSSPPERHIWALPMEGERKPVQITESKFNERAGRISPDGRWIAYLSSDQGPQSQLYVQSFPQPGSRQQVSAKGAGTPRWSRDGRELYYLAPDATLMAVSIKSTATSLDAGVPTALFKAPIILGPTRDYDVSSDGHFLINVTNPTAVNPASTPITVILNWPATLDGNPK